MRNVPWLASLVVLVSLASAATTAAVPGHVNVQGYLLDGAGAPLPAGNKTLVLRLFDSFVGGTQVWPSVAGDTQLVYSATDGSWQTLLGLSTPLDAAVFADSNRYLEITVDAGTGPPETLARIRLNAVPFAFAAGMADSAGNASALGGLPSSDYVTSNGDVMTGTLTLPRVELGSPAVNGSLDLFGAGQASPLLSLAPFGVLGASLKLRDESGNITHTLEADGAGEGGFLGVYGSAGLSSGFVVDGNVAGTGNPVVQIFGSGSSTVFNTQTTGDPAILLPLGSVSAVETQNEAGVAHQYVPSPVGDLTFTTTDILVDDSITFVAPSSGFIILQASGYWMLQHSFGGADFLRASISRDAAFVDLDNLAWFQLPPGAATGDYYSTFSILAASTVDSGMHTYYLNGSRGATSGAGSFMRRSHLVATFYPTAYGSVISTLPRAGRHTPTGGVSGSEREGEIARLERELEALRQTVKSLSEQGRPDAEPR